MSILERLLIQLKVGLASEVEALPSCNFGLGGASGKRDMVIDVTSKKLLEKRSAKLMLDLQLYLSLDSVPSCVPRQ